MMRLLIAEDDKALGLFLSRGLEAEGHEVRRVGDGQAAIDAFLEDLPDLTILDLNLPRRDGEEVLQSIRAQNAELPILILTGRPEIETRIRCLDLGADDFMLKPFSLQELRARCRALLRRRREVRLTLRCGELELNRMDRVVTLHQEAILLTNKEFALLEYLLLHRGRCVTRTALLEEVWKMDPAVGTNVVDVYINYLRKKLGDALHGSLIQTVRGQGYCIAADTPAGRQADRPVTPHLQQASTARVAELAMAATGA
ncbi:MAG TPA: response regulator transcription factor [Acidisarcina sp.]|nr:response regulator transcription factor [Acidisarcina sp.]